MRQPCRKLSVTAALSRVNIQTNGPDADIDHGGEFVA